MKTTRQLVIRTAKRVPEYPGRRWAENVFTVAFGSITEALAAKWTFATSLRCLGYWLVWTQTPGGWREMVDRGWLSRPGAYKWESEFRELFGVTVEEFEPSMVRTFFVGPENVTPKA